MNLVKISTAVAITCSLFISVNADEPKRQLKNNMMIKYNTLPSSAKNITSAFSDGMFYGRLRENWFKWDWSDVDTDNKGFGLGGSMIYKTAPFKGVSATAGFYYTNSPFSGLRDDNADVGSVKAGKDTFSRKNVRDNSDWSISVLGQAYLQYDYSKTTFKAGRQIFESFLTKSNDTKMIPNTFEGYSIEMGEIPKTKIRAAYFYAQKLRDHTEFHDVITFKDSSSDSWANNDDSAVHKGLSHANFVAAGKDTQHALIVADIRNKSIKNLQIDVTYGAVPDVVSSITGEVNYKIALPAGFSLTPGIRYMKQIDDGGGAIGGSTLKGTLASWSVGASKLGYKDVKTLDSSLSMARLVLKKGALKVQVGYSAVADEADIVAPWRGFPTGGYTRAMAQYNWYANTKTTSGEIHYDFDKANLVPGFSAMVRYAMQDFDEDKQAAGVQADSNVVHIDLRENITKDLYAKFRVGIADAENRVGSTDKDSYNEYRFELNYLF